MQWENAITLFAHVTGSQIPHLCGETMWSHQLERGAGCHGEFTVQLHLFFLQLLKPLQGCQRIEVL